MNEQLGKPMSVTESCFTERLASRISGREQDVYDAGQRISVITDRLIGREERDEDDVSNANPGSELERVDLAMDSLTNALTYLSHQISRLEEVNLV